MPHAIFHGTVTVNHGLPEPPKSDPPGGALAQAEIIRSIALPAFPRIGERRGRPGKAGPHAFKRVPVRPCPSASSSSPKLERATKICRELRSSTSQATRQP